MDYRDYLINKEWEYIKPNDNIYYINIFDDGISEYIKYPNQWVIFGEWRGKNSIFNKNYPNIIINSISSWKITILYPQKSGIEY